MKKDKKSLKRTQVFLRLNRTSGGGKREWTLLIEDGPSGSVVLEATFDNDTFADLMSHTIGGRTAEAKVYSGERIGLIHEYKPVLVPISAVRNYSSKEDADLLAALAKTAEEQNPGWIADKETVWNQHRTSDNGKLYTIGLRRWVEPKKKDT